MTKNERIMKPKEPIPEFQSREEEAEFWDTHDLADYWNEWKPVKVRIAKNLSEGITIRFDPETLNKLRTEAQARGIGPTTLARMWILERLRGANVGSASSTGNVAVNEPPLASPGKVHRKSKPSPHSPA